MPKQFFVIIILISCAVSLYGQRKCMPLDSALLSFSSSFNVSVSFGDTRHFEQFRPCFDWYDNDAQRTLNNILAETPYTFRDLKKGYSIFVDKSIQIVSGRVVSGDSKQPIANATIYHEASGQGTYADDDGRFMLQIPRNKKGSLSISSVGFEALDVPIKKNSAVLNDISLNVDDILPELLVDDDAVDKYFSGKKSVGQRVPLHQLYHGASIMGQSDPLRYMLSFAGVQSSVDGIGAMRIKGGSNDQNLVLMNGVPLYHQSHALGMHSVFNATNIQSASLFSGYIPAEYQGKAASVISINPRSGNLTSFHGRADISPFGGNIAIDAPLLKNKIGVSLSGRYVNVENIQKKIRTNINFGPPDKYDLDMDYQDFNLGLNFVLHPRHTLQVGAFYAKDKFDQSFRYDNVDSDTVGFSIDNIFNIDWENRNVFGKISSQWGSGLSSDLLIYHTEFDYRSLNEYYAQEPNYGTYDMSRLVSSVKEKSAKLKFTQHRNKWLPSTFGLQVSRIDYSPSATTYDFVDGEFSSIEEARTAADGFQLDVADSEIEEMNVFVENSIQLSKRFHAIAGVSVVYFRNDSFNQLMPQPRLTLQYALNSNLSVDISSALLYQQRHVVSNSNTGLPSDVWVPAISNFPSQRVQKIDGNISWKIDAEHALGINYYLNYQKNNIRFPNASFPIDRTPMNTDVTIWYMEVVKGKRRAWGVSPTYMWRHPKFLLTTKYTYSKSDEKYNEFINGEFHPSPYHRDHQVYSSLNWKLYDFLSIGSQVHYASQGEIVLPPGNYQVYDSRDSEFKVEEPYPDRFVWKTSEFIRLDLSLNFVLARPRVIHRLKASLFNVTDRSNFSHFNYVVGTNDNGYNIYLNHGPSRVWSLNYAISF